MVENDSIQFYYCEIESADIINDIFFFFSLQVVLWAVPLVWGCGRRLFCKVMFTYFQTLLMDTVILTLLVHNV